MPGSSENGVPALLETEQYFDYLAQAEHSPKERGMSRAPFSFWKEIDFQTVLM
jgi:hypothetical protein